MNERRALGKSRNRADQRSRSVDLLARMAPHRSYRVGRYDRSGKLDQNSFSVNFDAKDA